MNTDFDVETDGVYCWVPYLATEPVFGNMPIGVCFSKPGCAGVIFAVGSALCSIYSAGSAAVLASALTGSVAAGGAVLVLSALIVGLSETKLIGVGGNTKPSVSASLIMNSKQEIIGC